MNQSSCRAVDPTGTRQAPLARRSGRRQLVAGRPEMRKGYSNNDRNRGWSSHRLSRLVKGKRLDENRQRSATLEPLGVLTEVNGPGDGT